MAVQNPIDKPAVSELGHVADPVGAPPGEEVERRVQELFAAWLKRYFSGVAFFTKAAEGGAEEKTFLACERVFGRSPLEAADKPVLHLTIQDWREREVRSEAGWRHYAVRVTWNALVRVGAQAPVDRAVGTDTDPAERSDAVCRRVAAQLSWLLGSTEREALGVKGILRLRKQRGPVEIASGGVSLRQIVFTHECRYRVPVPQLG